MLATADVLEIKCKFVEKMIAFVKKRKYIMDPCITCIYQYYVDSVLVDLLSDCITYPMECALQKKAASYTDLPDTTIITPCVDQITLALSYSTPSPCNYTTSIQNQLNGSSYPEVFLTDDSIYYNIRANIVVSNDCGEDPEIQETIGGCLSGVCLDDYKGKYIFSAGVSEYFNGTNSVADNAYVRTLRIYQTDSTGQLDPVFIDLDLDPATSDYYAPGVDCPGCAALALADVKFGSANFTANFETLMDNVSLALFGVVGKHNLSASRFVNSANTRANVSCTALHNPSGTWFGIHYPDIYLEIYNTSTATSHVSTSWSGASSGGIRLNNQLTFTTLCGNLTPVIKTTTTSVGVDIDFANSSFNYIQLLSPYANKPLYGVSGTTTSCGYYLLEADYTSNSNITSTEWTDALLSVISTEDTAKVDTVGTYTFTIDTSNGCQFTDDITIT